MRAMQLEPTDFGQHNWTILKERVWTSRVIADSSTNPQYAPRSTMSSRQFGAEAGSLEGIWTHIIPLPSRAQVEALAVTLLDRIRPNPESVVTVMSQRRLDGIDLRWTSSVRAFERDTVGLGMAGREFNIVGAVNNVAFGVGYGNLGDGWTLERFVSVAQSQADKIRNQLQSEPLPLQ